MKYKAHKIELEIIKIHPIKETTKSVWIKTKFGNIRQERKEADGYKYFDTFTEAKTFLFNLQIKKILVAEDNFKKAQAELDHIKAMEEK